MENFVFNGWEVKNKKMENSLKQLTNILEKHFSSPEELKCFYDKISLETLVRDKRDLGDRYLDENIIHLLGLCRISIKWEHGGLYRVINESIDKIQQLSWCYSNPTTSVMRFNKKDERMLYISNSKELCYRECNIEENTNFSLIEYECMQSISLLVFEEETKDSSNSYIGYVKNFYHSLITFDLSNVQDKEEYYEIINDLKSCFGTSEEEIHGFCKEIYESEDKALSIGIKSEYEEKLLKPIKITSVKCSIEKGEKIYCEVIDHSTDYLF